MLDLRRDDLPEELLQAKAAWDAEAARRDAPPVEAVWICPDVMSRIAALARDEDALVWCPGSR